jgi:hypothetical protein
VKYKVLYPHIINKNNQNKAKYSKADIDQALVFGVYEFDFDIV